MKIFILGANGFIGNHLTAAILHETNWDILGIDINEDKITPFLSHPRFQFTKGDILEEGSLVDEMIEVSDVVIPLVAVATPIVYVEDPIRVFNLDFEANLRIIKECVKLKKRLIFPSTSEVYGMCPDKEFDEEKSVLVTGPIHKERWIYSTSKQLLDRLIFAYGKHESLSYTLFRPFNWYGPHLDNILNPKPGGSRVLTQFIGNIIRGEDIHLVAGGHQKRCFTYISDGIKGLLNIIENKNDCAHQRIFNLGNPLENISIRTLAERLVDLVVKGYPQYKNQAQQLKLLDIEPQQFYGEGYQDVILRVPSIEQAKKHLGFVPEVTVERGLRKTLDFYLNHST